VGEGRLSGHPADRLIRELVSTGRRATGDEIAQIVEQMAAAPFHRAVLLVARHLRGLAFQGRAIGDREDALTCHLIKRVVTDRQWAEDTSTADYLADLRRAVRAPAARLALYSRRGGHIAVTLAPTADAVPDARRAASSLPEILVVYSADRGMIVTGYQVSSLSQTGIPAEARWLK
jgi:hypothetical protein